MQEATLCSLNLIQEAGHEQHYCFMSAVRFKYLDKQFYLASDVLLALNYRLKTPFFTFLIAKNPCQLPNILASMQPDIIGQQHEAILNPLLIIYINRGNNMYFLISHIRIFLYFYVLSGLIINSTSLLHATFVLRNCGFLLEECI